MFVLRVCSKGRARGGATSISQSQPVRATAATMLMQRARTGAALALIWAASADAFLAPMGGVPQQLAARSRRGICHGKVAMAATTSAATGALREARAAKDMRFNKLGDSDLLVSEVCLGISSFPPGIPRPCPDVPPRVRCRGEK